MIGVPLSDQEAIPINGSEEEVDERYKSHMETLRLKDGAKKSKKEKGERSRWPVRGISPRSRAPVGRSEEYPLVCIWGVECILAVSGTGGP
eukprot:4477148-Pyramimonas_sp.AAC.1